jgi:pimeloyl-ACP methyl ester carboxylesterase
MAMIPLEIPSLAASGETVTLRGEDTGEGAPVLMLHGLTATRRNVVQGSKHLLRRGYRLIGYDARGHGESQRAPHPDEYEYADLVRDLGFVLERLDLERPVLAGSSMGGATAMAYALEHPDRLSALVQITPAYDGRPRAGHDQLEAWERLADGLEHGGVDGFVAAAGLEKLPERWREAAQLATRQRIGRNRDLQAVADAIRVVPGSRAFDGLDLLEGLEVPTLVIATRDEADPLHPLAVAEEYAERLPRGEIVVEDEGQTPLAWQGARLSRAIGDFVDRVLRDPPPG